MQIVRGSVVRALAGRDRGEWFIVLDSDGKYATICNGKNRSLERPKRKNIIHLAPSATILDSSAITTNREIRKNLRTFYNSID